MSGSSRDGLFIGRRLISTAAILALAGNLFGQAALGQQDQVAVDPDVVRQNWTTMSDDAFVDSVLSSMPARQKWEPERLAAYRQAILVEATRRVDAAGEDLRPIAAHANRLLGWFEEGKPSDERLQEVGVRWLWRENSVNVLTPLTVERLVRFAGNSLPEELRERLKSDLTAERQSLGEMSLAELRMYTEKSHSLAARDTSESLALRQMALDWMKTHRADDLTEAQLYEVLFLARPEIPNRLVELEATWEAEIVPPRDGEYEFSVCPIAISATFEQAYHRQWTSVEIGGTEVVKATPESWVSRGQPVTLRAGQAVPVRVLLRYEVERNDAREVAGQLYWKGPGLSQQLVAANSFRIPGSDEEGVRVSYRWKNRAGVEHQGDTVVSMIDQLLGICTPCSEDQLYREFVERAFDKSMAASASQAASNEANDDAKPVLHPWASDHKFGRVRPYVALAKNVSSADRRAICGQLQADAKFLEDAYGNDLLPLYRTLRVGARREALDLFGTWMQSNTDITPRLTASTNDYFWGNRQDYRFAVIALFFEDPEPIEWLEADFLVDDDENCCLPVAYTLAYSYVLRGNIDEWITKLDSRLSDDSLTRDSRVNWLIARAVAEEIRHEPAERHIRGLPNLSAGMGWLDEAVLVAESDAVRQRVELERLARLTAVGDYDAADAYLAQMSGDTTAYAQQIEQFCERVAARAEKDAEAARKAYVAELERRREMARGSGDGAAAERLTELLESFQ